MLMRVSMWRQVSVKDGFTVDADHVVMATSSPIHHNLTVHSRQEPFRTYLVGLRIPKVECDSGLTNGMLGVMTNGMIMSMPVITYPLEPSAKNGAAIELLQDQATGRMAGGQKESRQRGMGPEQCWASETAGSAGSDELACWALLRCRRASSKGSTGTRTSPTTM